MFTTDLQSHMMVVGTTDVRRTCNMAFSSALNEDNELIEFALSNQVILATPTSFIALLKAIHYGWRQHSLADNAQEIRRLAEDLHSRLFAFVNHIDKLGNQLSSSVENYNKAISSLESRVLPGARKFKELGANPKKNIIG